MITQTAVVTTKTLDGIEVKVHQESLEGVLQGTTISGDKVIVDKDNPDASIETTTSVVFDDLTEKEPASIFWTTEVPDDAFRIVVLTFFDGTKKVFSHPAKAAEFLSKLSPIRSPREQEVKVYNISEYRGEK